MKSSGVGATRGINDVDIMELEISKILYEAPHAVLLNLGSGQQGKSVLAHNQASLYWPSRDVILLNMPDEAFYNLNWPPHYRSLRMPKKLKDLQTKNLIKPSRDLLIIDDAIFRTPARRSLSSENVNLQQFLTIISHWELPIIYTIQNTSLLDISAWQSQNQFFFHKKMDPSALNQERLEYRQRQVLANMVIDFFKKYGTDRPEKSYSYCSTTGEILTLNPPTWWSSEHSKPLKGVIP